ncbi:hypothetical protein H072_6642 [Dactylellina haptotyla CBS 200.50]|uniref:Uncharacterized protein n=1 Tax=Dactylellina haptotyla (strain CBS 200.50) TaxID=1284197 RepID=S8AEL2_DACHA|nr:hypothetical protein H072_6642 [Dactylellina haptotyla CBS 200.50]
MDSTQASRPHLERSLSRSPAPPALTPTVTLSSPGWLTRSDSGRSIGSERSFGSERSSGTERYFGKRPMQAGLYGHAKSNSSAISIASRTSTVHSKQSNVFTIREELAWDTISMHEGLADTVNTAAPLVVGPRSALAPPDPRPVSRGVMSDAASFNSSMTTMASEKAMSSFLISQYLFQRLQRKGLIPSSRLMQNYSACGLLVRRAPGSYISQPMTVSPSLLNAVANLDVYVAFTMKSYITEPIFKALRPDQKELVLKRGGDRYQVVDSLEEIAQASPKDISRFQYICFVREERVVLLWHDSIKEIVDHAAKVEETFLSQILDIKVSSQINDLPQALNGKIFHTLYEAPESTIKKMAFNKNLQSLQGDERVKRPNAEVTVKEVSPYDIERGTLAGESLARVCYPYTAIYIGIAMAAVTVLVLGQLIRVLMMEVLADRSYTRLALTLTIPILLPLTWFFAGSFIMFLAEIIGPVGGLRENSRYYSARAPDVKGATSVGFEPPHITIQMPVYKESLNLVIKPTIDSLKQAITQYELLGGSANIFVNDDGMQALPVDEARRRIEYYRNNNIGWVARPRNGHQGFTRGGKFKKASNMNFALQLSATTERKLIQLVKESYGDNAILTGREEQELYSQAMQHSIKENGWAWAGGNIRVGELILLVDSDTRVPKNCLMYGAAEMFLNPEVAILQHNSGVMNVTKSFFENGMAYLTDMVYYGMRFCCGSGEPAPFVGHNAFIRWQALQSVMFRDYDGKEKWWSEGHVSEDFDLSFRLQASGNVIRLATYHTGDDTFQEGVSLTVYDELSRWKKYAYGSTELMFNPFIDWIMLGPFTTGFKNYLTSSYVSISSKFHIVAYLFSYHAMASALPLALLNYILVGWFKGDFDQFFIQSWQTFMASIFVFNIVGNVALAVLRYRLNEKSFLQSLFENLKWAPFLMVFFGGLSFHLNTIILSYLLSIPVQDWTGTNKEAENTNFFRETTKIIKSFKWMYIIMFFLSGGMIYLGTAAPRGWDIKDHTAIIPLAFSIVCHCLLPLALNPDLTKVQF